MALVSAEILPFTRIPFSDKGIDRQVMLMAARSRPGFIVDGSPPRTNISAHEDHKMRADQLSRILTELSGHKVQHRHIRHEFASNFGLHYDVPEDYVPEKSKARARMNTVAAGAASVLAGTVKPAFIEHVVTHSHAKIGTMRAYAHETLAEVEATLREHGQVDDKICDPTFYEGELHIGDSFGFWAVDTVRRNTSLHHIKTLGTRERTYYMSDFEIPVSGVSRLNTTTL